MPSSGRHYDLVFLLGDGSEAALIQHERSADVIRRRCVVSKRKLPAHLGTPSRYALTASR